MTHPTIQHIRVGSRDFLIVEVQNPTGKNKLHIIEADLTSMHHAYGTDSVEFGFYDNGQRFRLEVQTRDSAMGATHLVRVRCLDDGRFSPTFFNRLGQEPYTFPPVAEWGGVAEVCTDRCCG
jgi:hypothetical protein